MRIRSFALLSTLLLSPMGCTLEPLSVHPTQVQVARNQLKPLSTDPSSPGHIKATWDFENPAGYTYDPGKIEFSAGAARLKLNGTTPPQYPSGRVLLETSSGKPYAAIESFIENKNEVSPKGAGVLKYQLSPDGSKWFYHNGRRWSPAQTSADQANTAESMNQHVASFHTEAGAGNLFWRAWFISPTRSEPVTLKHLEISLIEAPLDFWD